MPLLLILVDMPDFLINYPIRDMSPLSLILHSWFHHLLMTFLPDRHTSSKSTNQCKMFHVNLFANHHGTKWMKMAKLQTFGSRKGHKEYNCIWFVNRGLPASLHASQEQQIRRVVTESVSLVRKANLQGTAFNGKASKRGKMAAVASWQTILLTTTGHLQCPGNHHPTLIHLKSVDWQHNPEMPFWWSGCFQENVSQVICVTGLKEIPCKILLTDNNIYIDNTDTYHQSSGKRYEILSEYHVAPDRDFVSNHVLACVSFQWIIIVGSDITTWCYIVIHILNTDKRVCKSC